MHRLLIRQLQRHFGADFQPTAEWMAMLKAVNQAYEQADTDRLMLERSLELSSRELIEFHRTEKESILRQQIESIGMERERFKALAQTVPAGVLQLDSSEELRFVNQEWLKITGITESQLANRRWLDAIHPDDLGAFGELYDQLVRAGRPFSCEHRIRTAGKREIWVYCTAVKEPADTH